MTFGLRAGTITITMRLSSGLILALATLPAASAFAPVAPKRQHQRTVAPTRPCRRISHAVAVVTGPNGTPAGSKEEDLALTIEVIQRAMEPIEGSPGGGEKTVAAETRGRAPPVAEIAMDVSKLDIRVGKILEAWEHEEADRLFCERIDIGEEEPRRIATGVRAHYEVEDLVGRRVCVLANLKSRKLMGFPSHGMVLCASADDGSQVAFLEPPADAAIGARCSCEGFAGEPATANQVGKKKILDKVFPDFRTDEDGVATYKGVPLTVGAGRCVAEGGLANAAVA